MFILTAQREASAGYYAKYQAYLQSERDRFPPSAFELATSDWYGGFHDHRAPHDAWLQSLLVTERAEANHEAQASVSIQIDLLGAYHDGRITMIYPNVFSYDIESIGVAAGLGDWRYDELRLNDDGNLLHEIEWWNVDGTNTWLIEASDVHHEWHPFAEPASG